MDQDTNWVELWFGGLGSSLVSSVFAALLVLLSFWLGRRAAREDLRRERSVQLVDAIGRFATAVAVRDQSRADARIDGLYDILRIAGRLVAAYQRKHPQFTAWLTEHVRALQRFLAERGSPADLPDHDYQALVAELGTLQGCVEVWADNPRTWRNRPRSPVQLPATEPDSSDTPSPDLAEDQ